METPKETNKEGGPTKTNQFPVATRTLCFLGLALGFLYQYELRRTPRTRLGLTFGGSSLSSPNGSLASAFPFQHTRAHTPDPRAVAPRLSHPHHPHRPPTPQEAAIRSGSAHSEGRRRARRRRRPYQSRAHAHTFAAVVAGWLPCCRAFVPLPRSCASVWCCWSDQSHGRLPVPSSYAQMKLRLMWGLGFVMDSIDLWIRSRLFGSLRSSSSSLPPPTPKHHHRPTRSHANKMLRKYWTPAVKTESGHIWALLWPIAISNALLMLLQVGWVGALGVHVWMNARMPGSEGRSIAGGAIG